VLPTSASVISPSMYRLYSALLRSSSSNPSKRTEARASSYIRVRLARSAAVIGFVATAIFFYCTVASGGTVNKHRPDKSR